MNDYTYVCHIIDNCDPTQYGIKKVKKPNGFLRSISHLVTDAHLYVASEKPLKINASKMALENVFAKSNLKDLKFSFVKGYPASSGVYEQPCDKDMTAKGAQNRLINLKTEVIKVESMSSIFQTDNVLRVFISQENGIMKETIPNIRNTYVFQTKDKKIWVDRCYTICELFFRNGTASFAGFSYGVTVPVEDVLESSNMDWQVTAGEYIAKKYDTNATDWHQKLAGMSRETILKKGLQGILLK